MFSKRNVFYVCHPENFSRAKQAKDLLRCGLVEVDSSKSGAGA